MLRNPSYEKLALFAGNLRTCVSSGLDLVKSLETCNRVFKRTALADDMQSALELVKQGGGLYDSLKPFEVRFPPFFLPVIRAGELSGRLDEALGYLEKHCRMLAGPSKALRNLWQFPLAAILFGTLIQFLAILVTRPLTATASFLLSTAAFYGAMALVVAAMMSTQLRPLVDRIRVATPFLGAVERDLAFNRFFHVLSLLYATGCMRVEVMIQIASRSINNRYLRSDLLRAAKAVEAGSSITDAFRAPRELPHAHLQMLVTGDEAGKLESVCEHISLAAERDLTPRLALMQKVAVRVAIVTVVLMIAQSVIMLVARVANMI